MNIIHFCTAFNSMLKKFQSWYLTSVALPAVLCVIAAGVYTIYLHNAVKIFPLDDAYIHFVYAENLSSGKGLCFNRGETSFGTSSPLWVILLALFLKTGCSIYVSVMVISFCCFFISALFIFLICREILSKSQHSGEKEPVNSLHLYSFSASALYLLSGNMVWLALSGMEVTLFHMLCLAIIYVYIKRGYCFFTALIAGLLLLCRVTGLLLLFPLIAVDCMKRKRISPYLLLTVLIPMPYYTYSKLISGTFFPVTARGKLLTYVEGGFNSTQILSFFIAVIKYLFLYEPAFFILFVLTGIMAGRCIMRTFKKPLLSVNLHVTILLLWVIAHIGVHGIMFRSLNQHLRYLSILFPVLSLLGIYSLYGILSSHSHWEKRETLFTIGLLVILCLFRQPFWRDLYHNNTQHMRKVYWACADWIKKNTAAQQVAAFDIGILKYVTGRYIVDLGGVTSSAIHPYLRSHSAGTYLRKEKVQLIVYSRFPDCDVWSGVYNSEYDQKGLLKQVSLASFSTDYYSEPSITHSFQLDVSMIIQWIKPSRTGVKLKFSQNKRLWNKRAGKQLGDSLTLMNFEIERHSLPIVWHMAQSLSITYCWRVLSAPAAKPLVKTIFVHRGSGEVIIEKSHTPTHNVYDFKMWEPKEILKERHIFWLPDNAPPGTYEIWVSMADEGQMVYRREKRGRLKRWLMQIAGLPLGDFPIVSRPLKGVKAGELVIESSRLKLLF